MNVLLFLLIHFEDRSTCSVNLLIMCFQHPHDAASFSLKVQIICSALHRKQIKLLLPESTENVHTYFIRDALIMTGMRKTASGKTRTAARFLMLNTDAFNSSELSGIHFPRSLSTDAFVLQINNFDSPKERFTKH